MSQSQKFLKALARSGWMFSTIASASPVMYQAGGQIWQLSFSSHVRIQRKNKDYSPYTIDYFRNKQNKYRRKTIKIECLFHLTPFKNLSLVLVSNSLTEHLCICTTPLPLLSFLQYGVLPTLWSVDLHCL